MFPLISHAPIIIYFTIYEKKNYRSYKGTRVVFQSNRSITICPPISLSCRSLFPIFESNGCTYMHEREKDEPIESPAFSRKKGGSFLPREFYGVCTYAREFHRYRVSLWFMRLAATHGRIPWKQD